MRAALVTLALVALAPGTSAAQTGDDTATRTWSMSATVAIYGLPDAGDYAQPTFTADRGTLHLEARYNYEALRTASVWAGYTFAGGGRLAWELTPMAGVVFGETKGVAPGYVASLTWWALDAYIEGEYVFAPTSADSFAYHWSEVAIAPFDWLRAGLATQRTRAYATDREIQRGPFVHATFERIDAAVYVFAPDERTPTVVLSIGWNF